MISTDAAGRRWSNKCSLCNNTRESPGSRYNGSGRGGRWDKHPDAVSDGYALACPWCLAVLRKYGSYWYPIDKSNEHLFTPAPTAQTP